MRCGLRPCLCIGLRWRSALRLRCGLLCCFLARSRLCLCFRFPLGTYLFTVCLNELAYLFAGQLPVVIEYGLILPRQLI